MHNELLLGTAAEHLVCADLLRRGMKAFRTGQMCSYDVACEHNDRLLRLQVKGTAKPRAFPQRGQRHITGYVWTTRRGSGGSRTYDKSEADAFALVAVDSGLIAYIDMKDLKQCFQIPMSGARKSTRGFHDFTIERLLSGKEWSA